MIYDERKDFRGTVDVCEYWCFHVAELIWTGPCLPIAAVRATTANCAIESYTYTDKWGEKGLFPLMSCLQCFFSYLSVEAMFFKCHHWYGASKRQRRHWALTDYITQCIRAFSTFWLSSVPTGGMAVVNKMADYPAKLYQFNLHQKLKVWKWRPNPIFELVHMWQGADMFWKALCAILHFGHLH